MDRRPPPIASWAMMKSQVRTPEQALAYLTDCTLATVCDLAGKKSRSRSEFERQKSMAQTAIDWMVDMRVDFRGTRAQQVVDSHGRSVDAWAKTFMPHP
ncbi:hypothetical protein DIE18_02445 [Burkholderia sp. Bp9125]|nr:hypothetical protein DIE18_02445 [Burkholderia sp. Bp9125]